MTLDVERRGRKGRNTELAQATGKASADTARKAFERALVQVAKHMSAASGQ